LDRYSELRHGFWQRESRVRTNLYRIHLVFNVLVNEVEFRGVAIIGFYPGLDFRHVSSSPCTPRAARNIEERGEEGNEVGHGVVVDLGRLDIPQNHLGRDVGEENVCIACAHVTQIDMLSGDIEARSK
jgi:hypothetical protein